jgi:5-methylcytosine-specific restriction enzyme A
VKARPWAHLYATALWRQRRLMQLATEPLCRFCAAQGKLTEARVTDHIEPHRGDLDKFHMGELQSLCLPCHNVSKQRIETGGYDSAADLKGYPISPNHPNGPSR